MSPGYFYFEEGVPNQLSKEIANVVRIEEKDEKSGKLKYRWHNKGPNHGFDIEKYQCLAA